MQTTKRYGYLDILKTIAILCVCLYHFPLIRHTQYMRPFSPEVLLLRYFRAFDVVCVPLFMMVNGALLLGRPLDIKKHMVRTLSLFAGMYIWYLMTVFCAHAWQSGPVYAAGNLQGMLLSAQYLYGYAGVETSHLWFVQMLVALYLIVPLLNAAFHTPQMHKGLLFFLGGMGVFAFLLQDIANVRAALPVLRSLDFSAMELLNPFRGAYGAMAAYFVLGGLMHRAYDRLLRAPALLAAGLILGGSVVLFAEWYLVTIRTEAMYDIVFGGYSCLPTAAMSIGVFIAAAKIDSRLRLSGGRAAGVIRLIGRNTLAIYYLHWIAGLTLLSGVQISGSFTVNLVKAAVMVLGCALLGEGLRRIPLLRHLV